jgi:hypothetical protein
MRVSSFEAFRNFCLKKKNCKSFVFSLPLPGRELRPLQDFLVVFYLQRNRHIEASQIHERLRHRCLTSGPAAMQRALARGLIVDNYLRTLPRSQVKGRRKANRRNTGLFCVCQLN